MDLSPIEEEGAAQRLDQPARDRCHDSLGVMAQVIEQDEKLVTALAGQRVNPVFAEADARHTEPA
jgi:hypothetical protein